MSGCIYNVPHYFQYYGRCFPLKVVKIAYSFKNHYLKELGKTFIKKRIFTHDIACKNYKLLLSTLVRRTESHHYANLSNQYKNNTRKTWRVIDKQTRTPNVFLINITIVTDTNVTSDSFNNFHVNICSDLAKHLNT